MNYDVYLVIGAFVFCISIMETKSIFGQFYRIYSNKPTNMFDIEMIEFSTWAIIWYQCDCH